MQKLGIKRQDHAQRIVKHITAKFNQDLYSRLQEFEGLYVPDNRGGLVSTTTPLTLCVEGNISAGKSTFLQYITNNNEELQQQLGVSACVCWLYARQGDRAAAVFRVLGR
jgi:polynucleotide 5'-kinase involved in rRNA processing